MILMKTLFSRILVAQVVAVVLALIVVTVITRASMNRGFKAFLVKQETAVLQTLAPALSDLYEVRGSWGFLRDNPNAWQRIWRLSHASPGGPEGPGRRRERLDREAAPQNQPIDPRFLRWMMAPERGSLRDRLFLLNDHHERVAGAENWTQEGVVLEAIERDGEVVGWIGFAPMGKLLPPDAERFLDGQVRITVIALLIALVVAAALAWILARNVSRPVRKLADTVSDLSRGEYRTRVPISSPDEIGDLAGHVNQLAETLEMNRSARQRWMADIAHELRTPVAILKGEIEALVDGVRVADADTSASLREEIEQLSALIDDLQTLALSDAGALNIHKKPLDLSVLAAQCAESFQDRLADRGIDLDLQVPGEVMVTADHQRLRQLLHNLLENSCRYVSRGGQVMISLIQAQDRVELILEDSGPGLTMEQIARIFERFYRAEVSRSRAGGGSGLGLSICKNIVEAHGGTILAEHSDMGGLKLRVSLPS